MKYLRIVTIFSMGLAACSKHQDVIYHNHLPPKVFLFAQYKKLHNGNYHHAIKELKTLQKSYPLGYFAQQIHIHLIYAYYKILDYTLTQLLIDQFLRLNPTHPHVAYVLYMRGLTNMTRDNGTIQRLIGLNSSDRNPEHARIALRDFTQLVREYPNSQYVMDANKRLLYLNNRLSQHEYSVVKYYFKRGAYIAVVNRVAQMLCDFPDTQSTRQALFYMEKSYLKLQLVEQANKVAKIAANN